MNTNTLWVLFLFLLVLWAIWRFVSDPFKTPFLAVLGFALMLYGLKLLGVLGT